MALDADQSAAAEFAHRFAEYWKAPTPAGLATLLAPDVRLVGPMLPVTHTLAAGQQAFADLLELIPDLTGEVHRWGATEDGVLIEFTLSGNTGGGPISWNAVDRFVLGLDGLATKRVNYFDSTPVALTVARRPRAWPGFVRTQIRRLRR